MQTNAEEQSYWVEVKSVEVGQNQIVILLKKFSFLFMSTEEIYHSALLLPTNQRADLISALIRSIDEEGDVYDHDLVEEAQLRDKDATSGNSKYLTEEEFLGGIERSK